MDYRTQAEALLRKVEKERKGQTLSLRQLMKTSPAAKAIFDGDPRLRVAVVESVVDTFSKLGEEKGPKANYWWGDSKLPWGSAEIADMVLAKDLPFTDQQLVQMLGKLTKIGLLTSAVVPCVEKLVRQVERRAAEDELSPALKKKLERFGSALSGRKLSKAAARIWKEEEHTPVALDRKIAGRIDRLVSGAMTL
jgi:hypothetical protein